jgi:hypothetical protein
MDECQQRAEQAEMAAFRLQLTIRFLVNDVRAYIARERVFMPRSEKLLELEQSAGIAEAKLREDEPWRAVAMRIALLEERVNGE